MPVALPVPSPGASNVSGDLPPEIQSIGLEASGNVTLISASVYRVTFRGS